MACAFRLPEIKEGSGFPSPRTGRRIKTSSVSAFVNTTLKWDIKIHPHGFRGTLRNWKRAKTNFDDVLWKLQVDHKHGRDESDEAYGADMQLERRREMMTKWDAWCCTRQPEPGATTGKVLEFTDKRRTA
jgi:hypothetical protein